MYRIAPVLVALVVVLSLGRFLEAAAPMATDTAVVQANSDFAFDLYGQLAKENQGKNLFFSPFSMSSALTMVAEGALGKTADQMGKVLRFPAAARAHGDEAQSLPWNLAAIHAGMAALSEQCSSQKTTPQAMRDKIATLRKQLDAANTAAEAAHDWQQRNTLAQQAQKLADELNKLLAQVDQYELRVANALWGEKTYPFRQSYLQTIAKSYRTGGVFDVDFRTNFEAARLQINSWVEEQTQQRIKDLVPNGAVDEQTRLVLTNAIYFKGEWSEIFDAQATKTEDFTLAGGEKRRVPLMHKGGMEGARYAAFQGDGKYFDTPMMCAPERTDEKTLYPNAQGFAMLELPYKGEELSMLVILPQSAAGLTALEPRLTAENLRAWVGKLQKRHVNVFLPRFKLETSYEVSKSLQAMGMVQAFKNPSLPDGADFSGMSESSDPRDKLYISAVLHKAFVEVNEKGTEAAAATAVAMAAGAAMPVMVPFTPTFRADKPFVFLIRHKKTGSILFLGRMMNLDESGA